MKSFAIYNNLRTNKTYKIPMEVCPVCEIGVGVTIYPDKKYDHYYHRLHDGMCSDCNKEFKSGALKKRINKMIEAGYFSKVQARGVISRMVQAKIIKNRGVDF